MCAKTDCHHNQDNERANLTSDEYSQSQASKSDIQMVMPSDNFGQVPQNNRGDHILSSSTNGALALDPTNPIHERQESKLDPTGSAVDGNGPIGSISSATMSVAGNVSSSPVSVQRSNAPQNSVADRRTMTTATIAASKKRGNNLRRNTRSAMHQVQAEDDEIMLRSDQQEAEYTAAAAAATIKPNVATPMAYQAPSSPRNLEDVDYWMKRAGWFDDDAAMTAYNQGVQDNYYSVDDDGSGGTSSSSGKRSSGSKGISVKFSSEAAKTALKAVLIVLAVLVGLFALKSCGRHDQAQIGHADGISGTIVAEKSRGRRLLDEARRLVRRRCRHDGLQPGCAG